MEQKEMIALLKSQMHMTYAERNEIAVHMNALSERLHQQEADIEKLVQERGTMRASSPTMEWISVEERLPELRKNIIGVNKETGRSEPYYFIEYGAVKANVTHWMYFPTPPKPKVPTFKDVLLEKFPFAQLHNDELPKVCVQSLFGIKCLYTDTEYGYKKCLERWNQPYFEKEGGEE